MSAKPLPAHIAALLQRSSRDDQGRPADSSGVSWHGRDLSGEGNPLHTFDGDDGLATAAVNTARHQLLGGKIGEAEFVNALAGERLFVPVIATGRGDAEHGDKESEISLVTLTASDGRSAMPVFTSVEALTAWHDQARPVAAETERVMLSALAEGASLVVLDPGQGLTFVVRRPAVEALAQGAVWRPSYEDEELAQELAEIIPQCPGVRQIRLQPHPGITTSTAEGSQVVGGGSGPELVVGVVVEPGLDPVDQRLAVATVQAILGEVEMLRRRADSVHIEVVR